MKFDIPPSIAHEHKELHRELTLAMAERDPVGSAAREVAALMQPHFVKEERYALPALSLLPKLSNGEVTPDMREMIGVIDKFRRELLPMLNEHKAIVAALKKLITAATQAEKPEYALFAEKLVVHAKSEEELLYPTALLIGEYLTLRFSGHK